MTSNTQLVKIALSHLGQGGARFRKFAGLPAGSAWCNAFVDYIANEAKVPKLYFNGKKETYCPHSIQWCRKNLAQVPLYLAMAGDIIYFDWDRNGNPNHIGLVRSKRSATSIYTVEGNTDGGKVASKTRAGKYVLGVFRPHFVPAKVSKTSLKQDGNFGYYSIYNFAVALGMKPTGIMTKELVKCWQKKVGATQDAVWGPGTSRKAQAFLAKAGCYTGKIDGEWGPASSKALQGWINKVNYPVKKPTVAKKPASTAKKPAQKVTAPKTPATTTKKPATAKKQTNAEKLLAKAKELAWAYGTAKKKYDFKTGNPKKVCRAAMKKYGWADTRAEMSDCGNFVSTIVRESGVDKSFKALHGVKTPFPKTEKAFKIVHKGAIPKGFLKPGDIIRYKKTNGKQHAMLYYGDGNVCEASHKNFFGVIRKDTKRYDTQSKKSTIQVLRAKE